MGLEIDADLVLSLGSSADKLTAASDAMTKAMTRPPQQPVWSTIVKSGVSNSGGSDMVLHMGGPRQGFYWDLKNLVVGGNTWAATVGGSALLVVAGQRPFNSASLGLTAVCDEASGQTPALPSVAFYSEGQVRIYPPDDIYVIFVGPTASTTYVAVARILEYVDFNREQVAI